MKFRMVDRIVSWEPRKRICGIKTVSFEEYSLKEPFGDEGRLPEMLVLESFFQLGNWLIVLSSGFSQMGLVVRTGQICFASPLRAGERMVMELTVRLYRDDGILFDGRGYVGSREVVRGSQCLAAPAPLADYCDPQDVQTLFSEIYRPEEGVAG